MKKPRWLTPGLLLVATGLLTAFLGFLRPEDLTGVGLKASSRGVTRYAALAPPGQPPSGTSTSSGSRSPASVPAGSGDGSVPPLLSFMRKNFPGDWVANYNNSGQLNGVTGGSIPKGATDATRAYALAVELGKLQGIRQEDLDSRNHFKGDSEVQDIYEFQQTYQGYPVFGSSIRLNAAKSDGTVYHVGTSLAEITSTDFSLGLQKDDVASAIQRLYAGRTVTDVKFVEQSPVIWARTSPQELAWVVSVDFKDEKLDRVRVVLGSKTGTVRGETRQLME